MDIKINKCKTKRCSICDEQHRNRVDERCNQCREEKRRIPKKVMLSYWASKNVKINEKLS